MTTERHPESVATHIVVPLGEVVPMAKGETNADPTMLTWHLVLYRQDICYVIFQ